MNIFLDTTVTFSDPFLKKGYNHIFLKLAKQYKDIQFYMSDVVFQETERHFKVNTELQLNAVRKAENALGDYKRSFTAKDKNSLNQKVVKESKKLLKEFEVFYKSLQEDGTLIILSAPNNLLPELIHRSVNRIMPFKEVKSEFRDAVTWLTYKDYIEKNQLNDCYFISNNVTDFFDNDKVKLHPDLIKDNVDIKPFINFNKLKESDDRIKRYIEEKERRLEELEEYIKRNNINEQYVNLIIEENINEIMDICIEYVEAQKQLTGIPNLYNDLSLSKEVEIDLRGIGKFKTEIIADEIIISASVNIRAVNFFTNDTFFTPIQTTLTIPLSITLNPELGEVTNIQYGDIYHRQLQVQDKQFHI
ncbi:PIN domain-containing protein [Bacillales bacterium AN1005]